MEDVSAVVVLNPPLSMDNLPWAPSSTTAMCCCSNWCQRAGLGPLQLWDNNPNACSPISSSTVLLLAAPGLYFRSCSGVFAPALTLPHRLISAPALHCCWQLPLCVLSAPESLFQIKGCAAFLLQPLFQPQCQELYSASPQPQFLLHLRHCCLYFR